MDDIVKRRLIGAVVLVFICLVLVFVVLLSSGADTNASNNSVHVYKILPDGTVQPVSEQGETASVGTPSAALSGLGAATENAKARAKYASKAEADKQREQMTQEEPESQAEHTPQQKSQPSALQPASQIVVVPDKPASHPEQQTTQPAHKSAPESVSGTNNGHEGTATQEAGVAQQGKSAHTGSAAHWVVQAGSFLKKSNAMELVDRLQGDYHAFYRSAKVNGKTWYRVRVGPFKHKDQANNAAQALSEQGLNVAVLHAD